MTREKFIELATNHYDSMVSLNSTATDFHDYEDQFVSILRKMGRDLLEANLGEPVADKRKKNTSNDCR